MKGFLSLTVGVGRYLEENKKRSIESRWRHASKWPLPSYWHAPQCCIAVSTLLFLRAPDPLWRQYGWRFSALKAWKVETGLNIIRILYFRTLSTLLYYSKILLFKIMHCLGNLQGKSTLQSLQILALLSSGKTYTASMEMPFISLWFFPQQSLPFHTTNMFKTCRGLGTDYPSPCIARSIQH